MRQKKAAQTWKNSSESVCCVGSNASLTSDVSVYAADAGVTAGRHSIITLFPMVDLFSPCLEAALSSLLFSHKFHVSATSSHRCSPGISTSRLEGRRHQPKEREYSQREEIVRVGIAYIWRHERDEDEVRAEWQTERARQKRLGKEEVRSQVGVASSAYTDSGRALLVTIQSSRRISKSFFFSLHPSPLVLVLVFFDTLSPYVLSG